MVERANLGAHAHTVLPPKLSKTPARIRGPAAFLGQHNDYVFGELLGMSQQERGLLAEQELIGTAPLAGIIPSVT